MANYNIEINYYNGSSYDVLYPKTVSSNVEGLSGGVVRREGSYIGTGSGQVSIDIGIKTELFILKKGNLKYPSIITVPIAPEFDQTYTGYNAYSSTGLREDNILITLRWENNDSSVQLLYNNCTSFYNTNYQNNAFMYSSNSEGNINQTGYVCFWTAYNFGAT